MHAGDRLQADGGATGFGGRGKEWAEAEVIGAFFFRGDGLVDAVGGLADERRRNFPGQGPARAPAGIGNGEIVLPHVSALRADRRDELGKIVDDQRNAGAFREWQNPGAQSFDGRFLVALGAELQDIDAAGQHVADHPFRIGRGDIAQIEDSVEASVGNRFHFQIQSLEFQVGAGMGWGLRAMAGFWAILSRRFPECKRFPLAKRAARDTFSFHCMKFRLLLMAASWLALALSPVRADERYSFAEGAHGFLVHDYNEKLLAAVRTSSPDQVQTPKNMEVFDAATTANTRLLQAGISGDHASAGRAGPAEFQAVGLPWPDDFRRCVNLIDCWEGTRAKLEGSSESEDNFSNVTFGIIGFTSHDGSLQKFLQRANAATNGAVFQIARERLSPRDAAKFIELVESFRPGNLKRNHEAFVQFVIRNPKADPDQQEPRPELAQLFASFDTIPQFREIQLDATRKKSWDAELPDYREALFGSSKSRSLRTDLFCFDMTVLTNGPGEKELRKLAKIHWHDEVERMKQIFAAMKRSPEFRDDEDKRADVLEREQCIIDGHGEVHDDDYDLRAFALLPE